MPPNSALLTDAYRSLFVVTGDGIESDRGSPADS
jgi:hypothetical protein